MTGPTHRAMDLTLVTGIAAAASLPLKTAVPAALLAYGLARAPDLVEGPLGLDHREQSHWPLVGIVLTLLAGVLAVVATGYVDDAGAAVNASGAQRDALSSFAEGLPLAVMLGVFCGYVGHIIGDSMTAGGAPLLGPFDRRDRFLLPKPLRIHVYHVVKDWRGNVISQTPSMGDRLYRYGAMGTTVLIVASTYGT